MGIPEGLARPIEILQNLVNQLESADLTLAESEALRLQLFELVEQGGRGLDPEPESQTPGDGARHRAEGRHEGPRPPKFLMSDGD